MNKLISATLIVAGIVHLLPLTGVLGAERLQALYGLSLQEPNLLILMRHRAVLFGLLGVFLIAAAFLPALQLPALLGGLISVASFVGLGWSTGGYNAAIARVVWVDVVAAIGLLLALGAYFLAPRS